MVKRLVAFVWLLFTAEWTACAQMAQATNPIAFRNVTVIDVIVGRAQPGMTVVISGDRIVEVGPASTDIPARAELIPSDGKFLIPGLWDMHMHAVGNPGFAEFTNPLLIAQGVTGVRSMGRVALPTFQKYARRFSAAERLVPALSRLAQFSTVSIRCGRKPSR